MPEITAIKKQKREGRVNVYIDGRFAFGVSANCLVDFNLYKGRKLSQKEIERIKEAETKNKCFEKAYRLLSLRPRSEQEISERLAEKFSLALVRETVQQLKDNGYINDREFASQWIKERSKNYGKKKIRAELLKKGVDKNIIDQLLGELKFEKELKSARDLILSKKRFQAISRDEAYRKVMPFLARRGFSYDVIKEIIKDFEN